MPTQAESPRVAALLLAAGSSRRMGRDKLRLSFHGGTVLEQAARSLADVPLADRVLVVRSRTALSFAPEFWGFRLVEIGDEAELGMHRSLKRGIAALGAEVDAALVCLGDQPFLATADYGALLGAYAGALPALDLLHPVRAGKRGNPALLHARYFPEILAEPDGDYGARYLFERHPSHALAWEAPSDAFVRDLDTPEDYERWSH